MATVSLQRCIYKTKSHSVFFRFSLGFSCPHYAYPFLGVMGASLSLDAPRDWRGGGFSLVGRRPCRTPKELAWS